MGSPRCMSRKCIGRVSGQHRSLPGGAWSQPSYCFSYASVLFLRWIRADPICISVHVLLACRPARRLRVCLSCYSQSASYPADYILAAVRVIGQHAMQRYPKLANCLSGIAQIHASYRVLHALG